MVEHEKLINASINHAGWPLLHRHSDVTVRVTTILVFRFIDLSIAISPNILLFNH